MVILLSDRLIFGLFQLFCWFDLIYSELNQDYFKPHRTQKIIQSILYEKLTTNSATHNLDNQLH